ncbi:MAG: hypothetical protein P8Y38_01060, partial [Deltaproteobacteria bacterium]
LKQKIYSITRQLMFHEQDKLSLRGTVSFLFFSPQKKRKKSLRLCELCERLLATGNREAPLPKGDLLKSAFFEWELVASARSFMRE